MKHEPDSLRFIQADLDEVVTCSECAEVVRMIAAIQLRMLREYSGLSTDQFYAGFADRPFETLGMHNVFLEPGGGKSVDDSRGWLPRYGLPPETVKVLLNARKAVVLDVSNGQIRDVTSP
jgi:hypothetical protein